MNYNLVDPTTGQVVGTVTLAQSANSGGPPAPAASQPGELGVNQQYSAGQSRVFSIHHGGGMLELKCDAVPGMGTFNSLTESLSGPGGGFPQRTVTPAGTLKSHQVIAQDMPPGLYTYTVAPDIDSWLVVRTIQG